MLKTSELHNLSIEDLKEKNLELRKELFQMTDQWKKKTQTSESSHVKRVKRKDRARVLTILRQKQMIMAQE